MSVRPGELYARVRGRIGEVLGEAGADVDGVRVPACPDWDIAQLTAHLAGTCAALVARDHPTGDVQAWVDAHVADRAGRTAMQNWAEWDTAGPAYDELLDRNDVAYGGLLFDAIVHEDDIRAALGQAHVDDPDAVAFGLHRLAHRADQEARRDGLGTLLVEVPGGTREIGEGEPVVTWQVDDAWVAMRALASRRSAAQLAALGLTGALSPWLAVLPYAPPAADLDVPATG